MEKKGWPWRKKSYEKITGETESSGSERFSDEQEMLKNEAQIPELSLKSNSKLAETSSENNSEENKDQTVKILSEKLSAAILDLNAKEALVKQHSKLAEEAVLGWEKAETELITIKNELNSCIKKNSVLEEKVGHLNGALKECVRELRQVRSDQETKIQDSLFQQSRTWDSDKINLQLQVTELRAKLEAKSENNSSKNPELNSQKNQELNSKISSLEKEISSLKSQLHLKTLEKELSIKSAETASKQRLETLKRNNKLEHECRKLRAKLKITNLPLQRVSSISSNYAESVTDSQSDNETSCSDSWSASLLLELDQFKKNEKNVARSISSNIDVALLDDFAEMERLVTGDDLNKGDEIERGLNFDKNLEDLKVKLEIMERKSVQLQKNLNSVNGEKHALKSEFENLEVKKGELELQLERAKLEIKDLKSERKDSEVQIQSVRSENLKFREKIKIIQKDLDNEKSLSAQLKGRVQKIDLLEVENRKLESRILSSRKEATTWREKVALLDENLEKERKLTKELKSQLGEMDVWKTENQDLKSRILDSKEEILVLRENVSSLQKRSTDIEANLQEKLIKEKALYEELEMKYRNFEMEYSNKNELMEKISLLEKKIESEKKVSFVYKDGLEASETKRNKLISQYEIACKEIEELRLKVENLENEIFKEREIVKGLNSKCKVFEEELIAITEPVISEDFKVKQEQERAKAKGKLAECQKSIDSISQQLKSLANLDDLGLEIENNEIEKENLNLNSNSLYSDKLAV